MRRPGVLALVALLVGGPAAAQDSTAAPAAAPDSAVTSSRAAAPAADTLPTVRSPVGPMGAFWRSLLVPGWGQARTDRRTAAAFFLATEGVALGMTITTTSQLHHLQETNSGSVGAKRQQREDWLVILGVNHLLSAMEAYVSAHLWDFPGDLSVRAAPGVVSGSLSLPVRLP